MKSVPLKFTIWLGITFLGILCAKLSFIRIYCTNLANNPRLNSWLTFHTDPENNKKYFQITNEEKGPLLLVLDYIQLLHYIMIIFYFGNAVDRMNSLSDLLYLFCFLVIPIFGFLGEIKGLSDFTITRHCLEHLTPHGKIVVALLSILFPGLMGYHFHLAYTTGCIFWYILGFIALPSIYVILYRFWLQDTPQPEWHIHHWFIGFFFCLFFRFDTIFSKISFMIFYSVFLQGSQVYTLTLIITNFNTCDQIFTITE